MHTHTAVKQCSNVSHELEGSTVLRPAGVGWDAAVKTLNVSYFLSVIISLVYVL